MLTIRSGGEKVVARQATEADWPGIVESHCTVPDKPWPRPPDEMTPEERTEYGGFWMSLETLRPHYRLYAERGSPILVAEDSAGRIVGALDLWLADEPEPVGRNAFVEIVEEHVECLGSGLENALIGYAANVARHLRYPTLDGSFGIGGLSTDYYEKRTMGFHIWDEHDLIEVACQPGPRPRPLAPSTGRTRRPVRAPASRAGRPQLVEVPITGEAVRDVVALGRWAPTEYIWRFRAEEEADRLEVRIRGHRCLMECLDASCVRGADRPGEVLDASLLVPGDRRHDAELVSELLRICAGYGAERGYRSLKTFIPSALTPQLSGVGICAAQYAGTCLRMKL
jgi:hypothetical protein